MKFDYDYKIQSIDRGGIGIVEYVVKDLGFTLKTVLIPYLSDVGVVHRICKENFPIEFFLSRYFRSIRQDIPEEIKNLRGTGSVSYDDYYYDLNVDILKTEVI